MDRALFGDEPLLFLKTICWFFVDNFGVGCLKMFILRKGCPVVCNWGNHPANVSEAVGNSGPHLLQGFRGCIYATLCQTRYRMLESIGDPQTNSSGGIGNFCK
jgi:hypothetical protein